MGAEPDKRVPGHRPVLVEEVSRYLKCRPGQVIFDCTLGEGGHALHLLPQISPGGHLIGIDRDGEALKVSRRKLKDFKGQVTFEQANFTELAEIASRLNIDQADRILFDLGVSTSQLKSADRGFSFQLDGPLDMRMDLREARTAADLVNRLSMRELERVLREFGEERWARRISRSIVGERERHPIRSTGHLVRIIFRAVPGRGRIHPATRTFQALRIFLNRELEALEEVLPAAISLLRPAGRMCVISFHSLEDRIVKHVFRDREREQKDIEVLTLKPVRPSPEEVHRNPKSRSAKLRAIEKKGS